MDRPAQSEDRIVTPFPDPPGPGEALEVADGVLWMRLPLPMRPDHVNVYAMDDGDGWTLIDTGLDTGRVRAVWQGLLSGPLAERPVTRVVVTHHHPDHIGLAGWFQSQGATLVTTRTAWLMARMLQLDVQDRPTAQSAAFWRGAGMPQAMLDKRLAERPFNFADCTAPLPPGFNRIADGGTIRIGGRIWDIRCGHGHAPDHATFWCRDEPLVIGGDQMLPGISPNLGVYPTEPDADPVGDWLDSCTRLAAFANDDHLVLPGHRLPYRGLPFRLRQMQDNHHAALARLVDHLKIPDTAVGCFGAIFGRAIGDGEFGLALAEAVGHLNHLHQSGRVTRTLRDDGVWLWQNAG